VFADAEIQKVVGQASHHILRQLQGLEESATAVQECGATVSSFGDSLDAISQDRLSSLPFARSEVRLRTEVGTLTTNLRDEGQPLRLQFGDFDDESRADRLPGLGCLAVDTKKFNKPNIKPRRLLFRDSVDESLAERLSDNGSSGNAVDIFATDGEPSNSYNDFKADQPIDSEMTEVELSNEFNMHDDMQDDIEAIGLMLTKPLPMDCNSKDNLHTGMGKIPGSFHMQEDVQDDIEATRLLLTMSMPQECNSKDKLHTGMGKSSGLPQAAAADFKDPQSPETDEQTPDNIDDVTTRVQVGISPYLDTDDHVQADIRHLVTLNDEDVISAMRNSREAKFKARLRASAEAVLRGSVPAVFYDFFDDDFYDGDD